jgi:glycosyltransferase involved in cell wall biosynthesis
LLRLVLVTRRFWPLVGGAERIMAGLGAELAGRVGAVTILTARWQPLWPPEITFRGTRVVRLPNPPQRVWGTWQYMRAVRIWLEQCPDHYDLVYVSMLKHDAHAALKAAARRRVPVVLRSEGAGLYGDCHWQEQARGGGWIRRQCRKAQAIVAPSQAIEEELLAAGYPRERIHRIGNGVAIPAAFGPDQKVTARAALEAANPRLHLAPGAPLAIYTGRLDRAKGLTDLVAAWEELAVERPQARLWLAGEGPYGKDLEEQIDARGLSGRVVLAGVFDSVDELLAAADVFVLPSEEEGMSLALLEAMAAGVPVVAGDIPGNRNLITHGEQGLLVPVHAVNMLRSAIVETWDRPDQARQRAAAARKLVAGRYSIAKMADEHMTLFERLLAEGK